MAALTLDVVRTWRPEALGESADGVERVRRGVESQVEASRATVRRLTSVWTGDAATAAADRVAKEVATGFELAEALAAARDVLDGGARDLGEARRSVLATVQAVEADGFRVGADGSVTPPSLPPVMYAPEDAERVLAEREAEARRLTADAQAHADRIGTGLRAVATVDERVATRLGEVDVPQSLRAAVDAYLRRVMENGDVLGALGAVGAGGVALAQTIQKLVGLSTRGSAFLQFLRASSAPITHYQAMLDSFRLADDALDRFRYGKADGGFLRAIIGSRAARLAGRAFLPLTVLTGAADAITGGGYDGARGWATRGFGLAGATGAGALLAAGALGLGPVGIAIAGGAVLAYGAWSLGNLAWDNREAIGEFVTSAATGVRDAAVGAWNATGEALDDAKDWAGDKLSDAGDALSDAGKGLLDVVSFGW